MAEEEFSNPSTGGRFPEGTLLGHYRLEWLTAQSSTGEVYSAIDTDTNRSCSVNIIDASVSGHAPGLASQLLSKAQAACLFHHPALVPVLETFAFPNCHCIVTEYLAGEFADQMILRGTLSEARVLHIGARLAELLSEAEKCPGLLFDFTPDTLLFGTDGEVRIFHPGISAVVPELPGQIISRERRFAHLIPFTAPELLAGTNPPDIRSSIYSLGTLLAFLLCGTAPCQRNNTTASIAAVLTSAGSGIDALEGISPETRALLKKMTARDPALRPASGKELLRLFGKRSTSKGCFKKIFTAGAIFLALAAAGAGVWGVFHYLEREEQAIIDTLEEQAVPRSTSPKVSVSTETKIAPPIPSSPPRKQPIAKAAPAEVLHKKIKIASVPQPMPFQASRELQLIYLRKRLAQLEKELHQKLIDPRLEQLHKERIEFRRKQILALSARNRKLEAFQNRTLSPEQRRINQQLQQEISAWGSSGNFRSSHQGKQPFPASKLQQPGIDYNMTFQIPPFRNEPLWKLLLHGFLMPPVEGARILAQADFPLLQLRHFDVFHLLRDKKTDEETALYLVRNYSSGYSHFSVLLPASLWKHLPDALQTRLTEEYLLQFPVLPGGSLHQLLSLSDFPAHMLRQLLVAEAPLEFAHTEGRTPLFQAFLSGNQEAVQQLLAAGADPDHRDRHGQKASFYKAQGELQKAILQGDLDGASRALDAGADPDFLYWDGRTPLVKACLARNKAMAELLLQKGANVNLASRGNIPPLVHVFPGHVPDAALFKLLVERGADTSVSPRHNQPRRTFMQELCERFPHSPQAPEFAKIMLTSGKFKTAPQDLFTVCKSNARSFFKTLVQYWPDLDTEPYKDLMEAALQQKMPADIIKIMVERKVPLPPRNELIRLLKNLNSPEMTALFPHIPAGFVTRREPEKKSQPSVPAYRKRKPLPHITGGFGIPVSNKKLVEKVQKALKRHQTRDLEALLDKEIPVNAIVDGMTLLQHAVKQQETHMVRVLLARKADPFKTSFQSRVFPICLAAENNDMVLFNLLLQFVPPNEGVHQQIMLHLLQKKSSHFFVLRYLTRFQAELKQQRECFLTHALRENASLQVVTAFLRLYGTLENPKHRSVFQQAIASRYNIELLKTLHRRNAPLKGAAPVIIKRNNKQQMLMLTVLQTAKLCNAPLIVMQFLREKGAK